MEPTDWKDFLLRYKWMPYAHIRKHFEVKRHDLDNFRRKPEVRAVLDPWRISAHRSPKQLRAILKDGWRYYLTKEAPIDFDSSPSSWVPELIAIKNVSKSGFSFLTQSDYIRTACPDAFEDFRKRGYTNVALAAFEFFPGSDLLRNNAILPYMFQQTHRDALKTTDAQSMIEHVYLNFLAGPARPTSTEQLLDAKERLYVRYREPGFVTGKQLSRFGVPANFFSNEGRLKSILEALHRKYGVELGFIDEVEPAWSSATFRKQFPERSTDSCEYCGLSPVDLHHLLPRKEYPNLIYDGENVVPLCANVHQRITRGSWSNDERLAYDNASRDWLRHSERKCRRHLFKGAMESIHEETYGTSYFKGGRDQ